MIDVQLDNKCWTSSFKKLLSGENETKLNLINKILRRATGVDQQAKKKASPIYPKEKYITKNKNNIKQIFEQRTLDVASKNVFKATNDKVERCHVQIYDTIRVERPKFLFKNIDESPHSIIDIRRSLENEPKKRQSFDQDFWQTSKDFERHSIDSNLCDEQKLILNSVPEKLHVLAEISRTSSKDLVSSGGDEKIESLDKFFEDEKGCSPSPIPRYRCPKSVEDKFVVNLYESRRKAANTKFGAKDDARCEFVDDKSVGEITAADTNIDETVNNANSLSVDDEQNRRKSNRITPVSVLEAMAEMEQYSGDDLIEQLQRRSSDPECVQSPQQYEEPVYAVPIKLNKTLSNKTVSKNTSDDGFYKLKQEADIQCKAMKQASKALEVLRANTKNKFEVLSEVEAERVLLTASVKHEALLQEIREGDYENPINSTNIATVVVKDLHVHLKDRTDTEWYVYILSDEKNVFCSKAVEVLPEHRVAIFKDVFTFENVGADFRMKTEIYSFKPQNRKRKSLFGMKKRMSKLCRKTLWYKDLHTQSLVESHVPLSTFKPQGSISMGVNDFTSGSEKRIMQLVQDSGLTGHVEMDARIMDIKIEAKKLGFLTVGMENEQGISWSRRWCVLNGSRLEYWNYPNEEDVKPPLGVVEVKKCIQAVAHAKRSFCPRPRTLYLEFVDNERVYLNADTVSDMHTWRDALNEVYGTLKSWSMLEQQLGKGV